MSNRIALNQSRLSELSPMTSMEIPSEILKARIQDLFQQGIKQQNSIDGITSEIVELARQNPHTAKELGLNDNFQEMKGLVIQTFKTVATKIETSVCGRNGEKALALLAAGPHEALQAFTLANQARAMSGLMMNQDHFPPDGARLGEADAFRHCQWLCSMAEEIGKLEAVLIGEMHEYCTTSIIPGDREMDLHNNAVGASLGTKVEGPEECAEVCEEALKNGHLKVIQTRDIIIKP